jgi:hypothetical protein
MDKRTLAKQIAKRAAHSVKPYLDRVMTCNNNITVKVIDGLVSMYVDNGAIVPYVPKSQAFGIWFGIDPEHSEEHIADIAYTYQLNSFIKYFS